jgi:hypothetical protein
MLRCDYLPFTKFTSHAPCTPLVCHQPPSPCNTLLSNVLQRFTLQIQSALERVRAGADVMPRSQLEGQLRSELGRDWESRLAQFDAEPRAAASIGQVHAALLHDGRQVAMKIQYPGGWGCGVCGF